MKSCSFESPKPYISLYTILKKQHSSTWYVIIAQSNPRLYHREANGCIFFWLAVPQQQLDICPQNASSQKLGLHHFLQMPAFASMVIVQSRKFVNNACRDKPPAQFFWDKKVPFVASPIVKGNTKYFCSQKYIRAEIQLSMPVTGSTPSK